MIVGCQGKQDEDQRKETDNFVSIISVNLIATSKILRTSVLLVSAFTSLYPRSRSAPPFSLSFVSPDNGKWLHGGGALSFEGASIKYARIIFGILYTYPPSFNRIFSSALGLNSAQMLKFYDNVVDFSTNF